MVFFLYKYIESWFQSKSRKSLEEKIKDLDDKQRKKLAKMLESL